MLFSEIFACSYYSVKDAGPSGQKTAEYLALTEVPHVVLYSGIQNSIGRYEILDEMRSALELYF
jgi:hypothetical protein